MLTNNNKFDLYFAGALHGLTSEFVIKHNANVLLSYVNNMNEIKSYLEERKKGTWTGKFFIDSGAFTAHTKGIDIDVDKYIDWLNENTEYLTIFAQVDKIPGVFGRPKTPEEIAEAPKLSWENYLYMAARLKEKEKLLPVFHQGEDFKWLHNILEYRDENGQPVKYMGVSPANDVSMKDKIAWLNYVYDIISRSSNPNIKTHALGMTALNVLEQYPFTSADSTTFLMIAVYGSIATKYGVVVVSDRQENNPKNICNLNPDIQESIKKEVEANGYNLEELKVDANKRKLYNLAYFYNWSQNYELKTNSFKVNTLF